MFFKAHVLSTANIITLKTLKRHPNLDQFLRIEQGQGLVKMGDGTIHQTKEEAEEHHRY